LKRVVIIAPDFAPSSMPPSLRVRFFASHLTEFGWEPIIISTKPEFYENAFDPENEKLLSPALQVIRTPAFSAALTRRFGLGDLSLRSLWFHWKALAKLCHEQKVDLIFISVPPYYSMLLGRLAYMCFRIPYVVDYIDPWVSDFYRLIPKSQRPSKWWIADRLSRLLEPIAVKQAAHLTAVSKATTDMVRASYPHFRFTEAMTTEIPYGGEISDFEHLRKNPRKNSIFDRTDGFLHFCYIGTFNARYFDTTRAVFNAVKLGLERQPDLFNRIRLHFVGTTYAPEAQAQPQVLPLAHEIGIETLVDEHPARVAYLESLQILLDSHALLALGSDTLHYSASKIFPYILSQRPFLAIFHTLSNVIDTVTQTNSGSLVSFDANHPLDIEQLYRALTNMLELPTTYTPTTNWDVFQQYTARAMAERLAKVLDQVVAHE